ncbi:IS1634 family transposase [Streptomyces sp. NBC_00988]|uniref:IS1634 family transposase n=1 Tax=Streptomyces sp. NBC_00988 TaxID=2903704 RepID=UPI00386AB553|nr:IS1634 family transposase [Streptomyces sp. NBC_00988]WSX09481.1 IS1634 family transposase [Streptomyces sp. NBC_00988]WSX09788.1 IS1634 family transposase [Streptomyces sp. NBC_00988]WSX16805.1 IS1634 family transposase [Streptomyces sp. NBC_00988]WSX17495.1 IS1634 family transposase [Streptomyces sp. NBC_00988]
MNVEIAPVVERRLGALPASAEFLRRLDVAGIIDGLCPVREVAHLTHGQVIEVLVANRLSAPAPLVRVGDWAREWAVEEVFGIEADLLNDDRIGRALDAIAPELEAIVGSVGASAIAGFGIDVSRLHWDMTSMSLHGAHERPEEGFPQVKYGHPKDRRADLKQIQAGIAISADGGIPVFHRAYDGGAGEVSQVVGAMTALRELAAPRDFLMVGDSKLISYGNLLALQEAQVKFIAPAPAAKIPDGLFAGLDAGRARLVDYTAGRDAGKPPAQRGRYRVLEDTQTLAGPRKRDPQVTVRRILVHSSANAAAQQAARTRRLDKAREELDKLQSACGGRHYATAQKVTARIGVITSKRRIGSCLVTSISTDETGRPALTWHYDQEVLAAQAATDGWYALLTTLDPAVADAAEVLIRYKGQPMVERRYSDFKGPLAVAPVFLHHNRRIAALITVICLALLVFCLIERQVRQALGDDQSMRGLYPDNRALRPTGRMILYHLADLRIRVGTATDPPTILITRAVQAHLLELLGIDETRPRWLETSNPTCEIRV